MLILYSFFFYTFGISRDLFDLFFDHISYVTYLQLFLSDAWKSSLCGKTQEVHCLLPVFMGALWVTAASCSCRLAAFPWFGGLFGYFGVQDFCAFSSESIASSILISEIWFFISV